MSSRERRGGGTAVAGSGGEARRRWRGGYIYSVASKIVGRLRARVRVRRVRVRMRVRVSDEGEGEEGEESEGEDEGEVPRVTCEVRQREGTWDSYIR